MKYYKYDIWKKINSNSSEEKAQAREEWKKNDYEYSKIFEIVKEKLSKRFVKLFLRNYGFHDSHLIAIEFNHEKIARLKPIQLILDIDGEIWKIAYKGIKKLNINHDNNTIDEFHFGDWGYSEFTIIDDKILSHEILLSSGATILVHFERISISKV